PNENRSGTASRSAAAQSARRGLPTASLVGGTGPLLPGAVSTLDAARPPAWRFLRGIARRRNNVSPCSAISAASKVADIRPDRWVPRWRLLLPAFLLCSRMVRRAVEISLDRPAQGRSLGR